MSFSDDEADGVVAVEVDVAAALGGVEVGLESWGGGAWEVGQKDGLDDVVVDADLDGVGKRVVYLHDYKFGVISNSGSFLQLELHVNGGLCGKAHVVVLAVSDNRDKSAESLILGF